MEESFESQDGDDDKIYLFFSENAVEYDFYSKVVVSRVARVCKVNLQSFSSCQPQSLQRLQPHSECSVVHLVRRGGVIRFTALLGVAGCGTSAEFHMIKHSHASVFRRIWAAGGHCRGNGLHS